MKISSRDWNINKILKGGYYKIPRFQRPYSWEKPHVQEFWSDVMLEENREYFIGAMVVYKQGMDGYGIVDGQQRLTTIIMLLCALRNSYEKESFLSSSRGIQALIERKNLSDESTYVLQTETSYPYFEEYILKAGSPETLPNDTTEELRLVHAFEQITMFIEAEINKIKKSIYETDKASEKILAYLDLIRDRVLELNVIFIELENVNDAQTAYETLNTRGKDLEASDLIKTYLMRVIKAMNSKVDIAKHNWNKINENIDFTTGIISAGDIGINSFLLHFWMSKYSYSSEKELFSKLKEKIGPTVARNFLKDLVDNSVLYKAIVNPEFGGWKKDEAAIKQSLLRIQGLRVVQQLPMVLSIIRRYKEGKIRNGQVRDLLESIEHFHYIFNSITTQRSSGSISRMYSSFAIQLTAELDSNALGGLIREFRQNLYNKLPSFEEFAVNFRALEYKSNFTKSKNIIRYTLSKIDEFMNKGGAKVDYVASNIEHILAQSPKAKTANHDEHVGSIGNLILINPNINSKLANKDFEQKKAILLKCGMFIDDTIKNATGWSEKEIDGRTDWLADVAYHQVFKVR